MYFRLSDFYGAAVDLVQVSIDFKSVVRFVIQTHQNHNYSNVAFNVFHPVGFLVREERKQFMLASIKTFRMLVGIRRCLMVFKRQPEPSCDAEPRQRRPGGWPFFGRLPIVRRPFLRLSLEDFDVCDARYSPSETLENVRRTKKMPFLMTVFR